MTKPQPPRVSVRRDHTLDAHLATIMRTGMTQTEAVRYAVQLLAQGLEWMWADGHVPPGTMPPKIGIKVPRRGPDQHV